jgi:hypothetical protein
MAQNIIKRRTGRSVTVSEKLARALVKGGRYDYVRSDMVAEPVAAVEPVDPSGDPEPTPSDIGPDQQEQAPTRAKRAYKRRDMQAS